MKVTELLAILCGLAFACGAPPAPATSPAGAGATPATTAGGPATPAPPTGGAQPLAKLVHKEVGFAVYGAAFGKPSEKADTDEHVTLKGRIRYYHVVCSVTPKGRTCINAGAKAPAKETKDAREHFDNWTSKIVSQCFQLAPTPMPAAALDALNKGHALSRGQFGPGEVPLVYAALLEKGPTEEKWSWETWTPRGRFAAGSYMTGENILALADLPRGTVQLPLVFPADADGSVDARFAPAHPEAFTGHHPGMDAAKAAQDVLKGVTPSAGERDIQLALLFDRAVLGSLLASNGGRAATAELKTALQAGPATNADLAETLAKYVPVLEKLSGSTYLTDNPCSTP